MNHDRGPIGDGTIPQLDCIVEPGRAAGLKAAASRLAHLGALKPGLTVDDATDVLWFYFGYSGFFTLMDDNDWSPERAEIWLREMATLALLRR